MSTSRYRLGVDVGGTHTDLVLLDTATGELLIEKVSSTPKNPALGVLDGVAKFIARGIAPDEIGFFAHGTTITTNALLEMRGAKVGLLITKGYRAVQEIQNQARDGNLFDYFYSKPAAIAPQSLTKEIPERCDYAGHVLLPLDESAVREAARELKDAGVESIAVCYLFSFMNPAHEEQTRALIHERLSRRPGLAVERGAAAHPRMGAAVDDPAQRLSRAGDGALYRPSQRRTGLRRSAHTTALPDAIERRRDAVFGGDRRRPHRAHVVLRPRRGRAGQRLSRARGRPQRPRHPRHGRHQRRHRLHRRRRTARSDRGGDRAPPDRRACARHDDDLRRRRLDRLDRRRRLSQCRSAERRRRSRPGLLRTRRRDGRRSPMPTSCAAISIPIISSAAPRRWMSRHRAQRSRRMSPTPLRMDVMAAAAGIQRIVDMRMADEVRVFAAKRGVDLSAFTLLPFGGAGAVHAAAVAEELGMRRILVPPRPGAFSALGLLCTDVVHDYIRSELRPLAEISADHAEDIFRQLERKARDELAAEGMAAADARFARELDLRYTGQGYELRTPLEGLFADRLDRGGARRGAGQVRRAPRPQSRPRRQGAAGGSGELSPARARSGAQIRAARGPPRRHRRAPSPTRSRASGACRSTEPVIDAVLYERDRLDIGATIAGPAMVEQFDATTVIPPRLERARRRLRQPDPGEGDEHGCHHHPDPAQQDRKPGR